jgi:hypothetical protein
VTHLRVMLHSRARLAWVKDISLSRANGAGELGAEKSRKLANLLAKVVGDVPRVCLEHRRAMLADACGY